MVTCKRAAELGHVIGFDLEQVTYSEDSIVIAGTVEEIAEALLRIFPDMTQDELIDVEHRIGLGHCRRRPFRWNRFWTGLRQAGLKLGVATNDGEMPALQHLESVGIRDHFDFVAGYDSGHGFKPGPGQLLAFATHVGVDLRGWPWSGTACTTCRLGAPPG